VWTTGGEVLVRDGWQAGAVGDDRRRGVADHAGDDVVVGVEDRDPAAGGIGEGLDEFGFCLSYGFAGAELAQVGRPDVEDDADLWRGERGQIGEPGLSGRGLPVVHA
jgi:hypothetical protein